MLVETLVGENAFDQECFEQIAKLNSEMEQLLLLFQGDVGLSDIFLLICYLQRFRDLHMMIDMTIQCTPNWSVVKLSRARVNMGHDASR